jgi:hypothetical protein
MEVNVTTDKDEDTWSGNALTFPTPEKARDYARALLGRWTLVRWWRVLDENDKIYHTNKHQPEGESDENGNLDAGNSTDSTE